MGTRRRQTRRLGSRKRRTLTAIAPQLHEADDDLAVPLDSLLSSVDRVANTRLLPGREARFLWARSRADRVGRETGWWRLAVEYVGVLPGTSDTAPSSRDRRFADTAWTENPVLRQVCSSTSRPARPPCSRNNAELDDRADRRLRLRVGNLIDALSPANNVPLNLRVSSRLNRGYDTRLVANLQRSTLPFCHGQCGLNFCLLL